MSDLWRNINEVQPNDGERVLVSGKYEVTIRTFNKTYNCWDDESGDDYDCDLDEFNWWLPLPEKFDLN